VRLGAEHLVSKPVPGVLRIGEAPLGLLAIAWSGALPPRNAANLESEVPARAVEELNVALALGGALAEPGEGGHERELAVVLLIDHPRFSLGFADHLRELAHPGAVNARKVRVLSRLTLEPRHLRNHLVEIGVGVGAVALDGFLRLRQIV
jgi:hypothetical protein